MLKFHVFSVLIFSLGFLAATPCWSQQQGSPESQEFRQILEVEWAALMEREPVLALYLGEQSSRLWSDTTAKSRAELLARYRGVLSKLQALDRQKLSESDRLNLDLFTQQIEWQLKTYSLGLNFMNMNQREGPHTVSTLSGSVDFSTLEGFRHWVGRLETFGDYVDSEIAFQKEAILAHRVQPQIITRRLADGVQRQRDLSVDVEKSAFFEPFVKADASVSAQAEYPVLRERARAAIAQTVLPALDRLHTFLEGPYLQASPAQIGLAELPGGVEAYSFLIQRYTTTDKSADEIHQLGLSEVARIRQEMEKIKGRVKFQGSLREFFDHLRTDPKYYPKDSQELLLRYRAFCKRVDGQMPKFFGKLPRRPYGVEPIPDFIAPDTTTAYYLPGAGHLAGTYFVNLYRPETRALFEIPALSLHESVPGHHHQIALAQELPELPEFRSQSSGFGDYTVFVEGWALYAESLGEEMGLYRDPYDHFGRYTYEMWRALRLVIDTGIHTKGWTREQAIEYFLNNSPRSRLDVTNEVDRYIGWPGQALAYKMGELEITRLRRWAESELGARFSLPAFHDAVLREGAVPLTQLQKQVEAYVAEINLQSRRPDL